MLMEQVYKSYFLSPVGAIEITCMNNTVVSVHFTDDIDSRGNHNAGHHAKPPVISCAAHDAIQECMKQLDEYFKGQRKEFALNINPRGTDFQKKVWAALSEIPYGYTSSYGEIARKIGDKNAARAVGNANNRNPVCIIIPCHRIIGSDGSLKGYGLGIWRKKWLLDHERKNMS